MPIFYFRIGDVGADSPYGDRVYKNDTRPSFVEVSSSGRFGQIQADSEAKARKILGNALGRDRLPSAVPSGRRLRKIAIEKRD